MSNTRELDTQSMVIGNIGFGDLNSKKHARLLQERHEVVVCNGVRISPGKCHPVLNSE